MLEFLDDPFEIVSFGRMHVLALLDHLVRQLRDVARWLQGFPELDPFPLSLLVGWCRSCRDDDRVGAKGGRTGGLETQKSPPLSVLPSISPSEKRVRDPPLVPQSS